MTEIQDKATRCEIVLRPAGPQLARIQHRGDEGEVRLYKIRPVTNRLGNPFWCFGGFFGGFGFGRRQRTGRSAEQSSQQQDQHTFFRYRHIHALEWARR